MQLKVVTGANPAAGAEITEAVPTGKTWRLLSARFSLVTSVAAATRRVGLLLDDGTTTFFRADSSVTQLLSLARAYNFVTNVGYAESVLSLADVTIGIPSFLLPSGFRVRSATDLLQGGDDYAAPVLYVAEFDYTDRIGGEDL